MQAHDRLKRSSTHFFLLAAAWLGQRARSQNAPGSDWNGRIEGKRSRLSGSSGSRSFSAAFSDIDALHTIWAVAGTRAVTGSMAGLNRRTNALSNAELTATFLAHEEQLIHH